MELEGTDAVFLEQFEISLNKVHQTNQKHALHFKNTPEDSVSASINFVIPLKMPSFMYDGSDDPTGKATRITREQLIDELPDTLVNNVSTTAFNMAVDKAISVMGDKVDYFRGYMGGLYISSPQMIVLIVDEENYPQ